MTEPDEALLWAREEWESWVRPTLPGGHLIMAHGYRAGAAASAERIKALEARVAELTEEVEDLRATNEALALPKGSVLIASFDWSEGDEPTDEDRHGWGGQG